MATVTLKEKAYQVIKSRILSCEYKPGSFVTEESLLNDTGTSRTPAREALQKLENEGLLSIIPKKGIHISDFSLKKLEENYEMRYLIEPHLVLRYGKRIPKEALRKELSRLENDVHDITDIDNNSETDLHTLVLQTSNNDYIQEIMDKILAYNVRLRNSSPVISEPTYNHLEETLEEHRRIITMLLNDEYAEAAELMKQHIEKSRQYGIDEISRACL